MQTTVMVKDAARFDMTGQFLGYPLRTVQESISAGLAKRLEAYARGRLSDAGFIVTDFAVEVYTLDGDEPPSQRSYCVKFESAKGGYIELIGILTKSGWPTLDHGFAIGQA